MHGSQKRASGDPYFAHPIEVAGILTEYRLDTASIVTALLHDVIEDTDATRERVEELFGSEIAEAQGQMLLAVRRTVGAHGENGERRRQLRRRDQLG